MTPEMRKWLNAASRYGGSFVKHFALTMLYADDSNFELLKPALLVLMEKHPHYSDDRFNTGD